ncbi:hypothetical protein CHS0354_019240 [Potamilus streckersoni]|uniref:G-patch domain-containing protein n=1 Tax=Potamilus streckersoni TaxID=2493646 RepID=A0AAE0T022_9BIVA|nr:hypothetical protein CHS0354_019240 [Potamilus streckersoni]
MTTTTFKPLSGLLVQNLLALALPPFFDMPVGQRFLGRFICFVNPRTLQTDICCLGHRVLSFERKVFVQEFTKMLSFEYRNLISFTSAKEEESQETKQEVRKKSHGNLTGEEVKSFYESVTSDSNKCISGHQEFTSSDKKDKKYMKRNRGNMRKPLDGQYSCSQACEDKLESKSYEISTNQHKGNELLRNAQDGDLNNVLRNLEMGVPVDYQDGYGWTALMCAVVGGHEHVVEYLLKRGANPNIRNNKRQTIKELAVLARKHRMVEIVDSCHKHKRKQDKTNETKVVNKDVPENFYCDVCKTEFTGTSRNSHDSSTVHLFNLKLTHKPHPFFIPSTNKGYQLLRKSGWDGEHGLGPEGKGQKYPIKTVLKRDRKCLGASDESGEQKAKITHFGPGDTKSVKSVYGTSSRIESIRTLSKRDQRKKEQRSRIWERNLRIYMSSD